MPKNCNIPVTAGIIKYITSKVIMIPIVELRKRELNNTANATRDKLNNIANNTISPMFGSILE